MAAVLERVLDFVDAINAGDAARIAELMTGEDVFIDSDGTEIHGREQIVAREMFCHEEAHPPRVCGRALAARESLASAVTVLMTAQRLDAIAYPTMRRRPALLGEPQGGSTCQLSAQSGLPAITMPAGFTPDGLPVGIELLGLPWSDARLVALAYSFEQAVPRRREDMAAGRLYLQIYTRTHPLGAARAQIR